MMLLNVVESERMTNTVSNHCSHQTVSGKGVHNSDRIGGPKLIFHKFKRFRKFSDASPSSLKHRSLQLLAIIFRYIECREFNAGLCRTGGRGPLSLLPSPLRHVSSVPRHIWAVQYNICFCQAQVDRYRSGRSFLLYGSSQDLFPSVLAAAPTAISSTLELNVVASLPEVLLRFHLPPTAKREPPSRNAVAGQAPGRAPVAYRHPRTKAHRRHRPLR